MPAPQSQQANEVEEVIKELKTNPGFSSYVIMNNDGEGSPVRVLAYPIVVWPSRARLVLLVVETSVEVEFWGALGHTSDPSCSSTSPPQPETAVGCWWTLALTSRQPALDNRLTALLGSTLKYLHTPDPQAL